MLIRLQSGKGIGYIYIYAQNSYHFRIQSNSKLQIQIIQFQFNFCLNNTYLLHPPLTCFLPIQSHDSNQELSATMKQTKHLLDNGLVVTWVNDNGKNHDSI